MKVLVVGAGPVGLTAALELKRKGADVRLIDQRTDGSTQSRAVAVTPHTMRLYKPSGVAERLESEAVKIKEVRFFEGDNQRARLKFSGIKGEYPYLFSLPQDRTETILRECLAELGVPVEYGQSFQSLSQSDAGVDAMINGETSNYDYLIGADGVHSAVRNALKIDYPGYDVEQEWSMTDGISESWPFKDVATYWVSNQGGCIVIPIGENRYRMVGAGSDPIAENAVPIDFQKVFHSGQFIISVRIAKTFQNGRVFLAGDSAHCHSPVGGRGMNLGIDDACELAERMLKGNLENYTKSRYPIGEHTLKTTERSRNLLLSGQARKRNFLLFTVNNFPARIQTKFVEKTLMNLK